MQRYAILHAAFAGLVITACAIVAGAHDSGAPVPVYSVAAIDRLLGSDLPRRLQQPVWVRAIAAWCVVDMTGGQAGGERCMDRPPMLVDPTAGAAAVLPLIPRPSPELSTWLSTLPVLSHWLLQAQTPRWNQVAVYRMQLVQIPFTSMLCRRRPCYGARLTSTWE
jgi:hypothetical protein